jgi:hypothetical protein
MVQILFKLEICLLVWLKNTTKQGSVNLGWEIITIFRVKLEITEEILTCRLPDDRRHLQPTPLVAD